MRAGFIAVLVISTNLVTLASTIKRDERVIFFPTVCVQVNGGWDMQVHGWIHEPEQRPVLGAILRRSIGVDREKLTDSEREIYRERTRLFLPDNERGKMVTIKAGTLRQQAPPTAANGHFRMSWQLQAAEFRSLNLSNRCIAISALLDTNDARAFIGSVHVLSNRGVSVISDIDDTIKISEIRDREALLLNTFCRPFKAAPGMADLYREWQKRGAQFHYVSASPWQLFLPLAEFVGKAGFPAGTFHMKDFRVKDSTFLALFADPQAYKLRTLTPLLKRFPQRRFILVGDSGEKDPEIYGILARQFPNQIHVILIRNVTAEGRDASRYKAAFRDLAADKWVIFNDPGDMPKIEF
jgi:phosphatidate phosphatase APP1